MIDDLPIGDSDPRQQAIFLFRQPSVEMEWPGEVFRRGGAKEVDDGFGRQLAGDVTSAMATHAVGHDVQRVVFEDGKAILVVVTLQTHVGDACCYCTHG